MPRLDLTRMHVEAVVTMLHDMLGDEPDERLLADMLEAETDLHTMATMLLIWIETEQGTQTNLKDQIESRQERKRRSEKREEAHRAALQALMGATGLDKLTLPEATVSVRSVPPKAIVVDEEAIPDILCRLKRSPNMDAIKAALADGVTVAGVSFDNGGQSLTIRRK